MQIVVMRQGSDLLFCKIESSEVKIDNSFSLYVGPERGMARFSSTLVCNIRVEIGEGN
jgi:hypothetical protein